MLDRHIMGRCGDDVWLAQTWCYYIAEPGVSRFILILVYPVTYIQVSMTVTETDL